MDGGTEHSMVKEGGGYGMGYDACCAEICALGFAIVPYHQGLLALSVKAHISNK